LSKHTGERTVSAYVIGRKNIGAKVAVIFFCVTPCMMILIRANLFSM